MKGIAWVFPGQGAQFPGMGKDFYEEFPVAKDILDRSDRAFGGGLLKLIFEGPKEALTLTENAQPAILALSVAQAEVLKQQGLEPDFAAGLSLGEYSALVVAGSMTLEDAVVLTKKRGRYMQESCPPGFGTMTAILGLSCADVESSCFLARQLGEVVPANYNCPGQIVISGKKEAVDKASEIAAFKGGRCIPLQVSAPFHCGYMRDAAQRLAKDLAAIELRRPHMAFYTNVTGERLSDPEEIRTALIKQVTHPVLWQTAVENMVSAGTKVFVEVGPGKSLTGFCKKTVPKVPAIPFQNAKDLGTVLDQLKEALLR